MMKVLRNWPSGVIGRTSSATVSRPAEVVTAEAEDGPKPSVTGPGRARRTSTHAVAISSPAPGGYPRQRSRVRLREAGRARREHQFRRRRRAERVDDRSSDDLVDQPLIQEPHLGLRRMHVDVDAVRRHVDEQVHLGTALLDGRDAVRLLNGVRDGPVAHDASVDEDVLRPARRPFVGERRDVPADADVPRLPCRRGRGPADHRTSGRIAPRTTRPEEPRLPFARRW